MMQFHTVKENRSNEGTSGRSATSHHTTKDTLLYHAYTNCCVLWSLLLALVFNHLHVMVQFHIVKENRGNEGTCVGISKWPLRDYSHRTTTDMWLYRAYSGNLYHNGEQTTVLPNYTHGDCITCVLDIDSRTLSFGKNGEVILYLTTLIIHTYVHVRQCSFSLLILIFIRYILFFIFSFFLSSVL